VEYLAEGLREKHDPESTRVGATITGLTLYGGSHAWYVPCVVQASSWGRPDPSPNPRADPPGLNPAVPWFGKQGVPTLRGSGTTPSPHGADGRRNEIRWETPSRPADRPRLRRTSRRLAVAGILGLSGEAYPLSPRGPARVQANWAVTG